MKLDARILVVDDDRSQRELLSDFLRELDAEVLEAGDGSAALETAKSRLPDVVITDYRMPGMDGHELLRRLRGANPEVEVIVVTAYAAVSEAVACLKEGAADYLLKPLALDEVEHVLRQAVERRHLRRENRDLRRRLGEIEALPGIVTAGGAMAEVLSTVARVAPSEAPVLVLGESGTGKELIARAIHAGSERRTAEFVTVNGASLSPMLVESELFGHEKGSFTGAERARRGRLETAAGGTLFLDEVGDLPPAVQVKLLRFLQEGTVERVGSSRQLAVDARVVAATHRDLPREVARGRFREDLYYRLAVVVVELPPLRRRRCDVPLLIDHFRARYAPGGEEPPDFSREARDLLVSYDYPGNVRELENIVQRCLVLARGDLVIADDLPAAVRGLASESGEPAGAGLLPQRVAALETEAIREALELEGHNQSRAAARLGLTERGLRYKLKKYGIRNAH